ncbi:hypothetical protein ABZ682_23150 [Streptomyces griseoviridis]|uniref:hypothetical protein n=1 Tax=Streptomyces griseoviridis TaxID=45398 RepID=UPI0033D5BDFE
MAAAKEPSTGAEVARPWRSRLVKIFHALEPMGRVLQSLYYAIRVVDELLK